MARMVSMVWMVRMARVARVVRMTKMWSMARMVSKVTRMLQVAPVPVNSIFQGRFGPCLVLIVLRSDLMRVEVRSPRADRLLVTRLPLFRWHQPGLTTMVVRRQEALASKRFCVGRLPLHLHPHLLLHVGQPFQVGWVHPGPQVHLLHGKLLQYGELSDLRRWYYYKSDPRGRGFSLPQQSIWSDLEGEKVPGGSTSVHSLACPA